MAGTAAPGKNALAYSLDTQWHVTVRSSPRIARRLQAFLERKWKKELDYRLIKKLWAFTRQPHRRTLCL